MKKSLTRGEKLLFASPLLFLAIAAVVWQWRKAGPQKLELAKPAYVGRLEFSPDNGRLLVNSEDMVSRQMTLQVSDLATLGRVCELATPSIPSGSYLVLNPVWSNDGKSIAARTYASAAGKTLDQISVWDATNGTPKAEYPRAKTYDSDWQSARIRFSSDGKTLIDKGVPPARYDVVSGRRLNKPDASYNRKNAELNENLGLLTLRNSSDKTFKVVDYKTKRVLWSLQYTDFKRFDWYGDVLCLSLGDKYEIASHTNRLLLWDGKTRAPLPTPPIPSGAILGGYDIHPATNRLVYSQYTYQPDPKTKSSTNQKYELVAWDYKANRESWRTELSDQLYHLQLSPDGQRLAGLAPLDLEVGQRFQLWVFDQSGKPAYKHSPVGNTIRWSPDSKKLATAEANTIQQSNSLTHYIEIHRFAD